MKTKATRRRMISCFAQIINGYVLGYKIPELVRNEKIKTRKFSRNPEVIEKFFWMMYNHLRSTDAEFVHCKHKGKLSRFKLRNIFAIDSTTLKLAYWCINWAKHRQNKAAVKVHMVANVASRLPHFCVYGKANEHDSKKEEILFESLNAGDIGILDRAYNNFETLYKQSQRGVIFVVREKETMLHEVVESVAKDNLAKNIIADETIRLTGIKTKESYPTTLRRVTAHVEINGHWHDLTFLTNNFEWAASTIAELYKARWQVEILFKELKQTLQLQDFFGENENAVKWQIWAAFLTHLILRYIKFKSRAVCSYSRCVACIRAVTWLKKELVDVLYSYGIAPPPENWRAKENTPYLPGFEKYFAKAIG